MQSIIRFNQKSLPVNLDCRCGVILEYIRKSGEFETTLNLDFCDKDGNVKKIRDSMTSYASNILTPGETYFLVNRIDENKNNTSVTTYTLLVELGENEPKIEPKTTKPETREPYKRVPGKPSTRIKRLVQKLPGQA